MCSVPFLVGGGLLWALRLWLMPDLVLGDSPLEQVIDRLPTLLLAAGSALGIGALARFALARRQRGPRPTSLRGGVDD